MEIKEVLDKNKKDIPEDILDNWKFSVFITFKEFKDSTCVANFPVLLLFLVILFI